MSFHMNEKSSLCKLIFFQAPDSNKLHGDSPPLAHDCVFIAGYHEIWKVSFYSNNWLGSLLFHFLAARAVITITIGDSHFVMIYCLPAAWWQIDDGLFFTVLYTIQFIFPEKICFSFFQNPTLSTKYGLRLTRLRMKARVLSPSWFLPTSELPAPHSLSTWHVKMETPCF